MSALRFNPLATLFVGSIVIGSLTAALTGHFPIASNLSPPWTIFGWCLLAVALIGNWAYVIAAGG